MKDEPLPGQKKPEKRRKRRWDRKPEVFHGYCNTLGSYVVETLCDVPHITFRENRIPRSKGKNKTKRK